VTNEYNENAAVDPGTTFIPTSQVFEDAMVVAYLAIRGFTVTAIKSQRRPARILFRVDGSADDIQAVVDEYYRGETTVQVQEFVRAYKKLRNQIFTMKQLDEGRYQHPMPDGERRKEDVKRRHTRM